jgi:hypothetical protein
MEIHIIGVHRRYIGRCVFLEIFIVV